ncbi:PEGA domain-containing protein [Candidatus Daviesbacteria bacterium]|nr:PEGA domain-containing protein [Candidatus Daviesbacteria bacterium]
MSKRFIVTIATLLIIAAAAGIAIFLAKGYSFSAKEKRIVGTGIINAASEPDAASVFVDGHLTTSTNATISSLAPKNYSIKVVKEGFIPWEKDVKVSEGLVTELKITLFPAIPTVYPLTFSGVVAPILSPDGSKLAYVVPQGKKGGVWVWTMARNQPLSFARFSEPHQIATNTLADFSKSTLRWSPDSKQVLATVDSNNYLLNSDSLNSEPKDITAILEATLKSWEDDTKAKEVSRIETIKNNKLRKIASDSALLRWSPDETKFMSVESVEKVENLKKDQKDESKLSFKVYDSEDRKDYSLPAARFHAWLPDSKHIILVEEKTISIVDFDGLNKAVIYAGNFIDDFVFPWPDSSRLVIISSFPTPTASEPNLYGINLK